MKSWFAFVRRALLLGVVVGLSALAAGQARPFPGPDLQQIYLRLLPQIEKIPAFDHHAHPGFADDPDVMPWLPRPTPAKLCAPAMIIPNSPPPPKRCGDILIAIFLRSTPSGSSPRR